jgi:hypothetical protein
MSETAGAVRHMTERRAGGPEKAQRTEKKNAIHDADDPARL